MAIELSSLQGIGQFQFGIDSLGDLICSPISLNKFSAISEIVLEVQTTDEFKARRIFAILVRKPTAEDESNSVDKLPPLSDDDLAKVSTQELDTFAGQLIEKNAWIKNYLELPLQMKEAEISPTELPADAVKGNRSTNKLTNISRLIELLHVQISEQDAQFKKFADSLKDPFGQSLIQQGTLDSIKAQMDQTEMLRKRILGNVDFASLDVQNKNFASAAKTIVDNFRFPATEELKQHIDKLNSFDRQILGTLSIPISEAKINQDLNPKLDYLKLNIPENPTYTTNQKLDDVLTYIEELRPIFKDAAGVLVTMSQVALKLETEFTKSAKSASLFSIIAVSVAAFSLIATLVSIWLSISGGNQQNAQFRQAISAMQDEIIQAKNSSELNLLAATNRQSDQIKQVIEIQNQKFSLMIQQLESMEAGRTVARGR